MTHKYFRPKDYDTFIGIDVDESSFSFTVKDHSTMKKSKKVPANTESFYNYIQKTYSGKKPWNSVGFHDTTNYPE